VRYLGASAFTFSMNAACSLSFNFGGGVVRVATGTPTSRQEFILPCGGADAKHTHRRSRAVVKLMRSVGGNVQCLSRTHHRFLAAKGCLHLAFQENESFLEVMPVRRRTATRRYVHVDDAEASIGLLARHRDGVGVTHQTDVRKIVRLSVGETSLGIVRW
jgi:hypothetical protein